MDFTPARQIAQAVLYEGYILYPYRASAQKNRLRWQFGALMPRSYSELVGSDPSTMQTECLIEVEETTTLHLRLRFLQAQKRSIEQALDPDGVRFQPVESLQVGGEYLVSWQEGIEREVAASFGVQHLLSAEREAPFAFSAASKAEIVRASGRIVARVIRESHPLSGALTVAASLIPGSSTLVKLRVRVANQQADRDYRDRDEALHQAMLATHLLIGAEAGRFVSLTEPPRSLSEAASQCVNLHSWPVLVGDKERRNLVLAAPIILYDFPQIAPESSGDFYDATEIDELLTLRTLTLTDEEKREARGTDAKAAAVLNRVETISTEGLARLHGAVRDSSAIQAIRGKSLSEDGRIAPGSLVRLRPRRSGDAQDMFLDGRLATVKRIVADVDQRTYFAVTLVDDPAAELLQWQGRYHYFYSDEIELVSSDAAATGRAESE